MVILPRFTGDTLCTIKTLVVLVGIAIIVSVVGTAITNIHQEQIIKNQEKLIALQAEHLNQTGIAAKNAYENRQLILDNRQVAENALDEAQDVHQDVMELLNKTK